MGKFVQDLFGGALWLELDDVDDEIEEWLDLAVEWTV